MLPPWSATFHHHSLKAICTALLGTLPVFLFLAALGLCCCAQAFSNWGKQELLSSCGVGASYCSGFILLGLPWWLSGKESACYVGAAEDVGSSPELGRSSGGGHGNPLKCSCLEKPMNRGAWQAMLHRVTKSRTRLKQLSTDTLSFAEQAVGTLASVVLAHGASLPQVLWDLRGPGMEPTSLALAGGFLPLDHQGDPNTCVLDAHIQ